MKHTLTLLTVSLLGCCAWAADPTLTVDTRKVGVTVSPSLWGIFFEELNHSGEGGLYPELVQGGTFEDGTTNGWTLQPKGGARGQMAVDSEKPLNAGQKQALRIDIETASAQQPVELLNGGYWGMGLKKGAQYRLSFFARARQFAGTLEARLESAAGQVYAKQTFDGIGAGWKRYDAVVTASAADPKAQLVFSANAPGTLWLDVVSVFPLETWKNRPNGLRPDLAEMLAALRPAFVRFPGGCYVEGGDFLKNAFRWPTTVKPLFERPGHMNRNWGYWTLDGLGYHEYLQMSEDLGAESLYVINAGMAHHENVPLDKLGTWVEEALNAVEYAKGPVTSKWGALRAKNGHPEPFNLKYIEIGNENGGKPYAERYPVFQKAIKAKYPDLLFIANQNISGSASYDIIDHHFYSTPEGMRMASGRYDTYDRAKPKVFVGEYAVNSNVGEGNLRGALGESAYMMGLERNSDVVVMAAYAPLFWNINNRAWPVNLIGFDSTRVFGTPSYYVQRLFAENRIATTYPIQFEVERERVNTPVERGAIGVGTKWSQAEFKDIRVTQGGKTLFSADLTRGVEPWRLTHGKWQVKDGALQQTGNGNAIIGDPQWTDYTLSLKARKIAGYEGFVILFRVKDDRNYYWLKAGGWDNSHTRIELTDSTGKRGVGPSSRFRVETGRWYDVRITVAGPRIECSIDGEPIITVPDAYGEPVNLPVMEADAGRTANGETVIKVVNFSAQPRKVALVLDGRTGELSGTATVLAGDPEATNTVDEPRKIHPVTKPVSGLTGPKFAYIFPGNALTILRLK